MAGAHRTLAEHIPARPSQVRDFYADLENIVQLHPLVESVHRTSRTTTASTYRIRDRIPLGPITLPITYRARIEVADPGVVTAQARQFPRVGLDSTVSFEPEAGGTRVTERLHITAPRPLLSVTVSQAVAAHIATWAGIRQYFGGAAG